MIGKVQMALVCAVDCEIFSKVVIAHVIIKNIYSIVDNHIVSTHH